ncbi:DUF3592 domain-containing protein [Simiduia agarivorans]|uniref:DUF3592 domain-containing protein n=1 Tax=Simiduia agarivorans (strain DSM 21679 / JCM 13881 / BCRC 17597 / SA1) TaxID=1117647 RepID=K4KN41_SIMAS|nr:DUF3592 domain-containing protein [Simiduia agarivorans]AFU99523.1 hypothetical protein M5M_11730 [Simiduia agarivorans SA1 = DSM 21679]
MDDKVFLFYLLGGVILLVGVYNLFKCLSRRKWPETVGLIQRNETRKITSNIISPLRTGLMGSFSSKSYGGTDKEIVLALSYVYAIDGYKYVGNKLYSAPVVTDRQQLEGLHKGDKVKVFYKPSNPAVSFLAHSFAWPSVVVILMGSIVLAYAHYIQINP